MRLYLSSKMTGLPDLGYPLFNAAEKALRQLGCEVSNPAQYPPLPSDTWNSCLKRDLVDMLQCDGVAVFGDYLSSPGSQLEVRTALAVGMPVRTLTDWMNDFVQLTLF